MRIALPIPTIVKDDMIRRMEHCVTSRARRVRSLPLSDNSSHQEGSEVGWAHILRNHIMSSGSRWPGADSDPRKSSYIK